MRGRSQRLNCEWLIDHQQVYLVQIDEEDEDFAGVNPFQLRIIPSHTPRAAKGAFLAPAGPPALESWDKLKVLDELWEPGATHKPTLFYVPLSKLPAADEAHSLQKLDDDFRSLIGSDNIIVRTSVRAGTEKLPNLPRTECMGPLEAATWCLRQRDEFRQSGVNLRDLSFVAHRFIGSRASAWIRSEPGNPIAEIHGLWGLPDALQYCPYDIWEVHVPTEVATEYPEYKSNILIPREDGGWEYVRVKNELARNLCISRREAVDLAIRSTAIAQRIGRPCHIMWFIGCIDEGGRQFSIPWYWTEAHEAEKNLDRSNYKVMVVSDRATLKNFSSQKESRARQAIELRPTDLGLMRDTGFIEAVGKTANQAGVPVILAGSTLAHAYYQLRREGCTVVTPGEKEHSRIRRTTTFGKLVRDKIPDRIAERQEAEITRAVPSQIVKGFLTGKLLEEALEIRSAETTKAKTVELADLYEVLRALANLEQIQLDDVTAQADEKRKKAGGFDRGIVLLQTGILGRTRDAISDAGGLAAQVLARKVSGDTYEIPFSFFGFMELDQLRSLVFDDLGMRLDVVLKGDRIELRLSREAEQFELPLDFSVDAMDDNRRVKDSSRQSRKRPRRKRVRSGQSDR
jgi:predicted house-cleaning noncanonical NTP pyrophosphatase (MazG superfamily)